MVRTDESDKDIEDVRRCDGERSDVASSEHLTLEAVQFAFAAREGSARITSFGERRFVCDRMSSVREAWNEHTHGMESSIRNNGAGFKAN
jgi:hypothetical protein